MPNEQYIRSPVVTDLAATVRDEDDGYAMLLMAMIYSAYKSRDFAWLRDQKPGGGRWWIELAGLDYEGLMLNMKVRP